MDALEFLEERKRMCSLHEACGECPLRGAKYALSISTSDENYKRVIATVEGAPAQDAAEHVSGAVPKRQT